ncbi:hypothetical protein [Streptantibioticus cattleyicolor]|uniref:hypothetical protein n=1 Tax=Streptantibioticus cattleyicolor TaxID=29303 RepID=UPI00030D4A25|nr:hypothetical protein [Streptantibioticus cattleyicolor]
MDADNWFEAEDPWEYGEAEPAFVAALRVGGTCVTRWEFADTGEALVAAGAVPADGAPAAHRVQVRP